MEVSEKIFEEISEYIPEEHQEKVKEVLNKEAKSLLESFNPTAHLKKGVINILDVNTGRMPRIKAEQYMRSMAKSLKPALEDYTVFYCARADGMSDTSVSYIEKGKMAIVNINTGIMENDKALEFVKRNEEYCKDLKEKGYDFTFVPRGKDQPAVSVEIKDE